LNKATTRLLANKIALIGAVGIGRAAALIYGEGSYEQIELKS
jgi:hypothetical protein